MPRRASTTTRSSASTTPGPGIRSGRSASTPSAAGLRRGRPRGASSVPLPARPATREELLRGPHRRPTSSGSRRPPGRRARFDPDTGDGPRSYEAALRAAGAVVGAVDARPRRGPRPGLLRGAPPGPPRRRRTGPWASASSTTSRSAPPHALARGLAAGRRPRLRRPPRQRHPGHLLDGPPGPLRLVAPVPVLPRDRRPRRGGGGARAGASPSTCRCPPASATPSTRRAYRGDRRADRPGLRPRARPRLRRLRRPPGRPAGRDGRDRGGLRGAGRRLPVRRRRARRGAASWPSSRAATTSTASRSPRRPSSAGCSGGPSRPRAPPRAPASRSCSTRTAPRTRRTGRC